MPRKPKALMSSPAGAILQLKIRLLDISPMIWRRVLVPAAFTLRELHGVIQVAMGWESLHLYLFQIRAVAYGSFQLSAGRHDGELSLPQERQIHLRLRHGRRLGARDPGRGSSRSEGGAG